MQNTGDFYAVITGSSMGIGRAMAEECAKRKWNVILISLPNENLGAVSREIATKYGVKTDFWEGDLTQESAPESIKKLCDEKAYKVNFLINNAGFGQLGLYEESKHAVNLVMCKVNMMATLGMIEYFLPEIKKHPRGWILNMASLAGLNPTPLKAAYSGTKAFTYSFSRALGEELRNSNVHVGVVAPGAVITNEKVRARIAAAGAMGRRTAVTPEYLAEYALNKLFKKKDLIIPGFLNQLIFFLGKHLPTRFVMKRALKALGKESKQ